MKMIKHSTYALMLIFFLASINGCKKDFTKINDDPNNPKDAPTSFLLTGAEKGIMDNTCDYFWNGYVGNQLAQYWASNAYTEESRYQFRPGTTNTYWDLFYSGGANDLQIDVGGMEELQTVINDCKSDPIKYGHYGDVKNQIAVATALKIWLLQNITDTWGDVPYSEALLGIKNTQPKFDKQSDMYVGMLAELDSAYANINDAGAAPTGDVIYGDGDMVRWRKFMNSLKLRLAIRMFDRLPALAATKINEAVSAGVFTSTLDNAWFKYLTTVPSENPLYHEFTELNRKDFSSSSTLMDRLVSLNDPRKAIYYDPISSDTTHTIFVGRPYGQDDATASATTISNISQPGALVESPGFHGIYLDYSTVEFMLAEAAERGVSVAGDPAVHYHNAVAASLQDWGVTDSIANVYMLQDSVDYVKQKATGKTWKQIIGQQKWIALYMQGIQGWIEWRRLDFGILVPPQAGPLAGTGIPNRMLYPFNEQSLNPKGYQDAVTNMGFDQLDTKVWWDMY